MGWNPNGNRISFTIFDDQFNPETSTVIVNTFQSNFVVCNVDYMYNGAFEVNCNNAPANAGQLHYTIINLPASGEGAQSTISQQVANQIAQRENAANQTQFEVAVNVFVNYKFRIMYLTSLSSIMTGPFFAQDLRNSV